MFFADIHNCRRAASCRRSRQNEHAAIVKVAINDFEVCFQKHGGETVSRARVPTNGSTVLPSVMIFVPDWLCEVG